MAVRVPPRHHEAPPLTYNHLAPKGRTLLADFSEDGLGPFFCSSPDPYSAQATFLLSVWYRVNCLQVSSDARQGVLGTHWSKPVCESFRFDSLHNVKYQVDSASCPLDA